MKYRLGLGYMSPLFFTNMEERVEEAAKHGWMICWMNSFFALYRKEEPSLIRCNIVLFQPGTFKGIPVKKRKEFRAICEDSGWRFKARTRFCQLYITSQEEAIDIRTDRQLHVQEIQKTMNRSVWAAVWMVLYTGFIFFRMTDYFNVMNLVTSNAFLGFVTLILLMWATSLINWLVYRYWYKRNLNWVKSTDYETEEMEYRYSNRFARRFGIYTILTSAIVILVLLMVALSMSISKFFLSSPGIWIGLIFGLLMRKYLDYSDHSEATNVFLFMVTMIVVILITIAMLPNYYEMSDGRPIGSKAIFLSDLLIDEEPTYIDNRSEMSVFTRYQVNYWEFSENASIRTKGYEFRSQTIYELYLRELLKDSQVIPLYHQTSISGGYLKKDQSEIYLTKGTSVYVVSTSMTLEEEEIDRIVLKLFGD